MRFYTKQHKFYCGIDLHTQRMFVCILDTGGNVRIHQNIHTEQPISLSSMIELIGMFIQRSRKLCSPVRQYPQDRDLLALKERKNPIIEHIRRCDRDFRRVDLGKGYRGIGVNDGLLINPPHSLQIPHIERILTQKISRMLRLNLIRMALPLFSDYLQGYQLRFRIDDPFLRRLLFQAI